MIKGNFRWLIHALSIFSELFGLIVTYGTTMMFVKFKTRKDFRVNMVGTSIALSNRLNSISSAFAGGLSALERQMMDSVVCGPII